MRPASSGRHGLPVALAMFALVAGASTVGAAGDSPPVAAAGTTLPEAVPPSPSYSYPSTLPGFPLTPSGSAAAAAAAAAAQAAGGYAASGIPARARSAYEHAATAAGCGLPWTVLAAIGRVESNHGRFNGATLLADGRSDPPIVGIALDGRPGVATIGDTDHGKYDGDATHDRAVGPMQFIPGTWARFAVDGDGDGTADPFDLDDASAAAAKYLCEAGGDLSTEAGQQQAVYSYNRSESYVRLVLDLSDEYQRGAPVDTLPVPDRDPRPLPPVVTAPTLPPVAVGTPPAVTPSPTRTSAAPTTTRPAPTTTRPAPTTAPTRTSSPTPPPSATTSPTTSPTPTSTPTPTCPPTSAPPTTTPSATPSVAPSGSSSVSPEGTPESTPETTPTGTPTGTPEATASPTTTPTPTCPAP